MKIVLSPCSSGLLSELIERREKKCVLYCDFYVANIIYEQNLFLPEDFLLYPDSNLMHFALRIIGKKKIRKTISTDLIDELFNVLNINKCRIFLFGDRQSILEKILLEINVNYPYINVVGSNEGYNYNSNEVTAKINKLHPEILLVGLGAGRQEKWIVNNYNNLPELLIISVGGYFQFLSGAKKRAPIGFRNISLEWLYRLITEFRDIWKKYSIIVVKFLYRVITKKIILDYHSN